MFSFFLGTLKFKVKLWIQRCFQIQKTKLEKKSSLLVSKISLKPWGQRQGKVLIEVMVFTQHVRRGEGLPCPKCILYNVYWEQGQEHQRYTHTHTHTIVAFGVKFTTIVLDLRWRVLSSQAYFQHQFGQWDFINVMGDKTN
jgi:hypothetical protein